MVLTYSCALVCCRGCLKWRVYTPLGHIPFEDVPLVEFMYLVFTSYRRRPRSLLCWCDVFRTLINSLVCPRPCFCFWRDRCRLNAVTMGCGLNKLQSASAILRLPYNLHSVISHAFKQGVQAISVTRMDQINTYRIPIAFIFGQPLITAKQQTNCIRLAIFQPRRYFLVWVECRVAPSRELDVL